MPHSDSRNRIMLIIAVFAAGLLISGAIGSVILLSYLSVLFILSVLCAAAIERHDREFNIQPYRGIALGLGALFLIGMTGIWLTWSPDASEASLTYVFGLPLSTAIYLTFIWFLPFFITVYYAFGPFDKTINDDIIDSIIDDARDAQEKSEFPMAPAKNPTEADD